MTLPALIGLRVVGDFHEAHPLRNRLGTIVGIAPTGPLVLWDGRRKPRLQHPALLHAVIDAAPTPGRTRDTAP